MTTPGGFDVLKGALHRQLAHLPAHRKKGPNTRYAIRDAAMGAFGLLFTPSPSFLAFQRRLQHAKGHNNAPTLLGGEQKPWDNQGRTRRAPIAPSHLEAVSVAVCALREPPHLLAHFRVLGDQLLVALAGPHSFASTAIHCHNCLPRQRSNGHPLYSHAALTPVIVCPGQSQGIALPPEDIRPQDGQVKQAGERTAGTRWLSTHAAQVGPPGST